MLLAAACGMPDAASLHPGRVTMQQTLAGLASHVSASIASTHRCRTRAASTPTSTIWMVGARSHLNAFTPRHESEPRSS